MNEQKKISQKKMVASETSIRIAPQSYASEGVGALRLSTFPHQVILPTARLARRSRKQ